jgi:hypothetical protein
MRKPIDPENPWPFFIAIDFESMDNTQFFARLIFVKFTEKRLPNIEDSLALDFDGPGKDVRF